MELEKLTDIAILGSGVLAHAAIIANRQFLRPALNNKKYDKFSLHTEHIIHHITQTLAAGVLLKYLPMLDLTKNVPISSALLSFLAGLYVDGYFPYFFKQEKPQYDQIASNSIGATLGCGLLKSII